jgi:YVTN family beta-propeller protein
VGELRTYAARAVVMVAVTAAGIACTGRASEAGLAARTRTPPASAGCSNPSDTVLAIRVATSTVKRVIKVGRGGFPDAIVMTPNGKTAYVALAGDDEVLPVSAAGQPGRAIRVGSFPDAITITPNGRTVYVGNGGSDTVTPIGTGGSKPGRRIKVGVSPGVIGITPNGRTVYVGNGAFIEVPSPTPDNAVVPISTATNSAGRALLVGTGIKGATPSADGFAFSRNGATAYVSVGGTDEVDPIRVAGDKLGRAIEAGDNPGPIVITPNGKTAYVADVGSDTVTPFSVATGRPGRAIVIGAKLGPEAATAALALTPNGRTLYVGTNADVPGEDDTVTPVSTATNRPGKPIRVGPGIDAIAITPNGKTAYVASYNAGTVTPIRLATGAAGKPIAVGTDLGPGAIAITPNGATLYALDTALCASSTPPGGPRGASARRGVSASGAALDSRDRATRIAIAPSRPAS